MKPIHVIAAAAAALAVAGAAMAQPAAPAVVEVRLSNFHYDPGRIELTRGQPYVLRLTNTGGHGHSFKAKAFFQTVSLGPGAEAKVKDGEVEVGGGETVDVPLTPNTAGSYEVHCDHPMHAMLGMKGQIVVE